MDWAKARIGFLDVETSNLQADFGYVHCWWIKEHGRKAFYHETVTRRDLFAKKFDKRILTDLGKVMKQFDVLVVYWGSNHRHDVPFLRTRCLVHGLEFPGYGEVIIWDLYDTAKNKLRLHSNRLDSVGQIFGYHDKTRLDPLIWMCALIGDPESLAYIDEHCKQDTILTEKVFDKLERFRNRTKSAI